MCDPNCFTLGDLARRYGVTVRQLRSLFEKGILPPAKRLGIYRVVADADLPAVEAALRKKGLLGGPDAGSNAPAALAGCA